jgi:hypothetical protein
VARDPLRLIGKAGWTTGHELLAEVSRSTVERWVKGGLLVRLQPGIFALPAATKDWQVRVAAAVHGREAVASHATALALWG